MNNGPVGIDSTVALTVSLTLLVGVISVLFYVYRAAKTKANEDGSITKDRIGDAQRHSKIDIEKVAEECKASCNAWKDPTFGHDAYPGKSIGYLELRDGERGKPLILGSEGVTWQPPSKFTSTSRPMGIRGDGVPTWLYSDNDGDGVVSAAESMEANDVTQGSVGDCYFLAALAAVVQHHPDLADDLIDETYEEQGIYGVSFWRRGCWRMTWVDSYFPCYRPSTKSHRGKHRLIFAGATDRKEIWPLVVEKAYAKVTGSYEAISGGHVSTALEMLTGGKARRREPMMVPSGTEWDRFKEEVESDEYFVGAGSQRLHGGTSHSVLEQKKVLKGIVTGHAYSVLSVYENEEHNLHLVELRNPWGHGEWSGDWGPGSRKWNTDEGRTAISIVGRSHSNDGRFWMEWKDFVTCFDSIDTCHMNFTDEDRARRAALKEVAETIIAKQDRPERKSGTTSAVADNDSGKDEAFKHAEELADAMMEQLLAEEAKEKRMNQIGARGNKKGTGKKKKSGKKGGKH